MNAPEPSSARLIAALPSATDDSRGAHPQAPMAPATGMAARQPITAPADDAAGVAVLGYN